MNHISKNVAMNSRCLMMYSDYLLNKCYQFKNNNAFIKTGTVPGTKPIAVFCSVYCDDCNGSCMNSRYATKLAKPFIECSKLCNDNIYNDCICL